MIALKTILGWALLAIAAYCGAQEVQNINPLQGFVLKRQSLGNGTYNAIRIEKYATGNVTLPAWYGTAPNRGYGILILATNRPPNTSVMWLSWSFESRGLFSSNPAAHAAFITRSVSSPLSNVGQGFIVGGLETLNSVGGACPSGYRTQPETWHENTDGSAGNVVLGGGYCGPQLLENRKYNAVLHSASGGYAYSIQDSVTGQTVHSVYVSNASPSAAKLEKGTGFTVGIVFADAPGTSWEFEVSDLEMGWF